MTDTTASNDAALDGNVLFYGKPEPLSSDLHGKLGVNPVDKPYAFVAQSHVVPLTVTEFAPAALSYPVIFLGDAKQPVAVMGLRQSENLYRQRRRRVPRRGLYPGLCPPLSVRLRQRRRRASA